jgi:hypothetical protein
MCKHAWATGTGVFANICILTFVFLRHLRAAAAQALGGLNAAAEASGPVRDHRPLCCQVGAAQARSQPGDSAVRRARCSACSSGLRPHCNRTCRYFQRYISTHLVCPPCILHARPQVDDFLRCAAVPKRKGANFRDLPGVHTWGNGAAAQPP